jgi:hypothetical protein
MVSTLLLYSTASANGRINTPSATARFKRSIVKEDFARSLSSRTLLPLRPLPQQPQGTPMFFPPRINPRYTQLLSVQERELLPKLRLYQPALQPSFCRLHPPRRGKENMKKHLVKL